ncbi:MAG: DEAD/DEAH box helicase [Alphaproteobacteria bacterium]|nr:DEAD/DEAH box helicase [Alphaproteobacteria bacterium]
MSFESLGLSENILRAVADTGYTNPTPIQAQAIPIILMGRDLVGLAQTGTGKTAGFTLPMIEILAGGRAKARMPRSLILSPTRELAAQIAENFDQYGKYHKLSKALLVGGSSLEPQIAALERGVDVLIATPGRLIDLFERGKILMSDIKILVIDEADRMLDMGFIPDIEKICSKLPPIRQTLLFSATMPNEIRKLTQKFQSNPKEVSVAPPATTAEKVEQNLVWTSRHNKRRTLESIISGEDVKNAFIFCNRKRDVDDLARDLQRDGYAAKPMHGDMVQKVRTETLQAFKEGRVVLMVCSDVAGRGLDIDDVSHVFNYDVPFNADDYVHRIGRTGRAGKTGHAWTIATREDEESVAAIEKLIKKKIPVKDMGGGKRQDSGREERGERPSSRLQQPQRRERPEQRPRPQQQQQQRPPREAAEPDTNRTGFGDDIPGFFGKSSNRS